MNDQRQELGRRGEDLAARHLEDLGYQVVARNAASRLGELDLVALDGEVVVLVEVKTRRRAGGRTPAEAVDWRKRRKLVLAGQAFLQKKGWLDRPARFDVVEVVWPPGAAPKLNHLKSAFAADDD